MSKRTDVKQKRRTAVSSVGGLLQQESPGQTYWPGASPGGARGRDWEEVNLPGMLS